RAGPRRERPCLHALVAERDLEGPAQRLTRSRREGRGGPPQHFPDPGAAVQVADCRGKLLVVAHQVGPPPLGGTARLGPGRLVPVGGRGGGLGEGRQPGPEAPLPLPPPTIEAAVDADPADEPLDYLLEGVPGRAANARPVEVVAVLFVDTLAGVLARSARFV